MHDELGNVTHYIVALHDVTAERRARETLEYRAYHDPPTGLANRHLLADRFERLVAHARRHKLTFALLLLDLNGFKAINDRYGHDAGDALLRHVSARLEHVVRGEDTVARLGGDEFVLLLANSVSRESVEAELRRVRESLRSPLTLRDHALCASCCMGMAPGSRSDP